MSFTELHAHTDASNVRARDSTNKVPDLIQTIFTLGHRGLAITDHDCLTASLKASEFVRKKKESNAKWRDFKLILGNEIYLCPNNICKENPRNYYPHFILNALDAEGYKQIRAISTRAWKRAYMRNLMRTPTHFQDLEDIIKPNKGHVVGSSACLGGSLPRHILETKDSPTGYQECLDWIEYIDNIFGHGNFFLELQPSDHPDQIFVNQKLVELSKDSDVPFIITNDVHYLRPEDRDIHRAFLQSQSAERETDEFYYYTYAKTEEEMHEILDKTIGIENCQKGIDNTNLIYERVEEYDLKKPLRIPYICLDHTEPDKELADKWIEKIPNLRYLYESDFDGDRHLCRELINRIEVDKQYQNEATYEEVGIELESIKSASEKMGVHWSAYLITEQNIVNAIWNAGSIVGVARGSGAGFLLLNILGITQVNPLREEVKTYHWRFLNPYRASPLDIDIDIPKSKREVVLQALRDLYGEGRVTQVLTLNTEKSRSAILTAMRGYEMNVDYAQYIASLITSERGITRTLHEMYYGDEDSGLKPDATFVREMDANPKIWEAAQKIEGLICGMGVHPGGVIIDDVDFNENTSLMRTNSGTLVTSYDLHDAEACSLIKTDILSISLDKIQVTLELLLQSGEIEWQGSLRDTYEKYLGVYTLERDDVKLWELCWNHKVISLFQMEKESGRQALALMKPTSVGDLAVLNSTMRLMPPEGSGERPLEKLARFKAKPELWYREMDKHGLTKEEQEILKPIMSDSYGICEAQELLFLLVMEPHIGGFDLGWADTLRKQVAKKIAGGFEKCEEEFFENARQKNLSRNLTNYVWRVLVSGQKGYGFNRGSVVWRHTKQAIS